MSETVILDPMPMRRITTSERLDGICLAMGIKRRWRMPVVTERKPV